MEQEWVERVWEMLTLAKPLLVMEYSVELEYLLEIVSKVRLALVILRWEMLMLVQLARPCLERLKWGTQSLPTGSGTLLPEKSVEGPGRLDYSMRENLKLKPPSERMLLRPMERAVMLIVGQMVMVIPAAQSLPGRAFQCQ
jgi:hypothetical protein